MAASGIGGMGGGMSGMSGCSGGQHLQMGGASTASAKQNSPAAKPAAASTLDIRPNLGAKLDISI